MIVSAREELHKRLAPMLEHLGGTMDPHQAWLVLRGLRTLAMRVEKAQEHALATTGISEISRKSETPN